MKNVLGVELNVVDNTEENTQTYIVGGINTGFGATG